MFFTSSIFTLTIVAFLKRAIFLYLIFSTVNSVQMFCSKIFLLQYSNCGPLLWEAIALPTEPLSNILVSLYWFFLKIGHPRPLFSLFSSFQTNITISTTKNVKNVHPGGIRNHGLQNVPLRIDQSSHPFFCLMLNVQ